LNDIFTTWIAPVLTAMLLGYAVGNISPAYVIGRLKGYDVRKDGSGNAGASNTLILVGKAAGLFVAVVDIFKTWAVWKLAELLFGEIGWIGAVAGASCSMGHMYPILLHFKGGRGFACLGGMVMALSPRVFLVLLGLAILIGILTNYVCIVACAMSVIYPVFYGVAVKDPVGAGIMLIPAVHVFFRHRENFRRIKEGTELRLSYLFRKDKELERTGHGAEMKNK